MTINSYLHPVIIFVTFQYFTVPISTCQNGEVQTVKLNGKILKLFGVYLLDKVLEI